MKEIPQQSITQSSIPNPEASERLKITIGFDFVFDKNGYPYCIEINGHNSGISGLTKIPPTKDNQMQRLFASIRNRANVRRSHIIDSLQASISSGQRNMLYDELKNTPLTKYAHENPVWLQNITNNKSLQSQFIPHDYRPRTVITGDFTHLLENGIIIIKPKSGAQGNGIEIYTKKDIDDILNLAKEDSYKLVPTVEDMFGDDMIVQEFITPKGADNAKAEEKDNPSSLRLLIDAQITSSGQILPEYVSGYQRISREAQIIQETKEQDGTLLDEYVVNKSTGAAAVEMSQSEYEKVYPIAIKILKNIYSFAESQKLM